jgi:hypothetical protein
MEAAGDDAVDNGLLLLPQQLDQLLLGVDVAPDAPVRVVEEADDGGLFGEGWEGGKALVGFLSIKAGHRRIPRYFVQS